MVMHARKFRRLNDGYSDKVSSHSVEEKTLNSADNKKIGSEYYNSSPRSPSRFQNRAQPSARLSDRERKSEDSHHNSHNFSREMRTRDQKQKDHKAEVHRLAENICGDWSEHISSSGKRYYYNCKTEVSQWEKPKDWNDLYTVPCSGRSYRSNSKQVGKDKVRQTGEKEVLAHHSNSDDSMVVQQSEDDRASHPAWTADTPTSDRLHLANLNMDFESSSQSNVSSSGLLKRHRHQHVNPTDVYEQLHATDDVALMYKHNGTNASADFTGEDMDISPGSTPTEESFFEKRMSTGRSTVGSIHTSSSPACSAGADLSDPRTSSAALTGQPPSNSTFLNTLAALQQALQQATMDKSASCSKSVPSSMLSTLAALPSLICQLRNAEHTMATPSNASALHSSDQQQLTQNVINMLQKLQLVLVAQQQQQQQRQLQELLLQLLTLQKHGNTIQNPDAAETPTKICHTGSPNESKMESPYSPPDSNGTPLGSPENKMESSHTLYSDLTEPNDMHQAEDRCSTSLGQTTRSPHRHDTVSPGMGSNVGSNMALQSSVLVGTSQLAAASVNRKHDSAGLTPTLANYVNLRLVDHVSGWQTDITEKQGNCYSEESHSLSSLHCTQVSVDLKRARSLVRINEIQSTLQEQRVMFMRQQTKDLENMRTGLSFYAAVPSGT